MKGAIMNMYEKCNNEYVWKVSNLLWDLSRKLLSKKYL